MGTQHRPPRESDHKERARLSRENHAMQRQIARLKRQLQEAVEQEEKSQEDVPERQAESGLQSCSSCGSVDVGSLVVPGRGTLVVCKQCGNRSWS